MARYYTEDLVAKIAWWSGVLMGVLLLVWSFSYAEYATPAILQLVMLLGGKLMYPEQRLGRVEDNPLKRKTRAQRRYTSSRTHTLLGITVGLAGCLAAQLLLTSTLRLGLVDLTANLLGTYTLLSAAVSESYLLHWGLQSNLSTFVHPYAGVLAVPLFAMVLHSFAYGTTGPAILVVGVSFLVLAWTFEFTKRLSVPIIIHLLVNLMVV